jgi:hypothetical protein
MKKIKLIFICSIYSEIAFELLYSNLNIFSSKMSNMIFYGRVFLNIILDIRN